MARAKTALLCAVLVNLFAAVSCSPFGNHGLLTSHTLHERASPTFEKASTTGQALTCLMRNDIAGAEAYMRNQPRQVSINSPWTNYDDIFKWGWRHNTAYTEAGFDPALNGVIRTLEIGNIIWWFWRQDTDVTVDNVFYPASGARLANGFACDSGYIIADENYGPAGVQKDWPEKGIPYVKLNRWSDIAFLTYQKLCGNKPLKGVIRVNVVSETNKMLFKEIKETATWGAFAQRLITNRGDANFNALLGSPNVYGVAWLLINHKDQLGVRYIPSISIFDVKDPLDPDDRLTCLYIPIEAYYPPSANSGGQQQRRSVGKQVYRL